MASSITFPTGVVGKPALVDTQCDAYRVTSKTQSDWIHTDAVYNTLVGAAAEMEDRLQESLTLYKEHPDSQANLQQLQYDLQSWNLALTMMTNIQKNMADALSSVASNMR